MYLFMFQPTLNNHTPLKRFMTYNEPLISGIIVILVFGKTVRSDLKCPVGQHSFWNVQLNTKNIANCQGIEVFMFSAAKGYSATTVDITGRVCHDYPSPPEPISTTTQRNTAHGTYKGRHRRCSTNTNRFHQEPVHRHRGITH